MDPIWTYAITAGFAVGLAAFLVYFIRQMNNKE